jgi:hypothetical protein
MESSYKLLLKNLQPIELPLGLKEVLLNRIHKAEVRREQLAALTYGGFGFLSLIALGSTLFFLVTNIENSGLLSYLSLIYSEGFGATDLAKELVYSIIESIPAMSLTLTFLFLLTTLASLRKLTNEVSPSFFTVSLN